MEYLFNFSCLILLLSWSLTNIFAIRATAIIAYFMLLQYSISLTNENSFLFFWTLMFILANLVRFAMLLKDIMPRDLPEELRQIKESLFEHMNNNDFLRFMKLSQKAVVADQQILQEGDQVKNLMLISEGQMHIQLPNGTVELGKHHFIGEMSYFHQGRASNTVFVKEPAGFYYWDYDTLRELQRKKPNLFMKLVEAMGKDIVMKMIDQKKGPDLGTVEE